MDLRTDDFVVWSSRKPLRCDDGAINVNYACWSVPVSCSEKVEWTQRVQ